jgi:hypothetical protein
VGKKPMFFATTGQKMHFVANSKNVGLDIGVVINIKLFFSISNEKYSPQLQQHVERGVE